MPLYIKDDAVSLLAEHLATALSTSKTEAVKRALTDKMAALDAKVPLAQRLSDAQVMADKLGPVNPAYRRSDDADQKWGA
jgi:antitoxin VapB